MTNASIIRHYIASDYSRVRTILAEGDLYYEPIDSQERMEQKISKDPNSIFVALESNLVIGTVSIMEDGRMAFVFRLGVTKVHRNKGIGASLMDRAEKELKNRGYKEINILVNEENTELKDYYRKQKYEEGNLYRWMTKETKF